MSRSERRRSGGATTVVTHKRSDVRPGVGFFPHFFSVALDMIVDAISNTKADRKSDQYCKTSFQRMTSRNTIAVHCSGRNERKDY